MEEVEEEEAIEWVEEEEWEDGEEDIGRSLSFDSYYIPNEFSLHISWMWTRNITKLGMTVNEGWSIAEATTRPDTEAWIWVCPLPWIW